MIAFKTRPILPFALLYVLGLAILGLANLYGVQPRRRHWW
jgi:hypothetical protein